MEARRSAREETPNQRQVKCAPRSEHARPDELKLVLARSCDDTLRRIGTRVGSRRRVPCCAARSVDSEHLVP